MSSRKVVHFFYDVTSHYSWLAFEVICRYRRHWPMDLVLRPCFLAGILQATDNKPPGILPARGRYMRKDITRLAAFMDVPLKISEFTVDYILNHGTLAAQRFLTAANQACPQYLESLSRELWIRLWSNGEEIHEDKTLLEAALRCGIPSKMAEELGRLSKTQEIKQKLRQVTDEAIELGAFGMPCTVATPPGYAKPQLYFGGDRLEVFAHEMGFSWKGPHPDRSKL